MWSDGAVRSDPRDDVEQLRATAVAVARQVGDLVARLRIAGPGQVETKTSATDVVTAADTAAERLARHLLAQWRPGEPVLGEEEGGSAAAGALCWVVDPIDGTVNYLYGLPWYAVSVAVQRDGQSLAAAVAQPAGGRLWSAGLGQGADCNGVALQVNEARWLELSLIGTGFSYRPERRARQARLVACMLPRVRDVRRAGSAALDLCCVASGWLDGFAEHGLRRWDWAAGALIAAEAGAVVRLPPPGAEQPGSDLVLAAAPGIAAALADLLEQCGAAAV
ncbi:MAG TPA: inositol monophosphatase family protein [Pseudonocardiaceae bacterium]|jgi:myo-inositol-1(or 4)-monophosphatase|nr:inositol monophosphatase family protein [Pseudonocardiaceae bacterium]